VVVALIYVPLHDKSIHCWIPLYWISVIIVLAKYCFQLGAFAPTDSCHWYSCCTPDARWVGLVRVGNNDALWSLLKPQLLVITGCVLGALSRSLHRMVNTCTDDDRLLLLAYRRAHAVKRALKESARSDSETTDSPSQPDVDVVLGSCSVGEGAKNRLPASHSLLGAYNATEVAAGVGSGACSMVIGSFQYEQHLLLANIRHTMRMDARQILLLGATSSLVLAAFWRMNLLSLIYLLVIGYGSRLVAHAQVGRFQSSRLLSGGWCGGWVLVALLWLLIAGQYFRVLSFPPSWRHKLGIEWYELWPWRELCNLPTWACASTRDSPPWDDGGGCTLNATSCCPSPSGWTPEYSFAEGVTEMRLPMPPCALQWEHWLGLGEVDEWGMVCELITALLLMAVLESNDDDQGADREADNLTLSISNPVGGDADATTSLLGSGEDAEEGGQQHTEAAREFSRGSSGPGIDETVLRRDLASTDDCNDFMSPVNGSVWHLACWLVNIHLINVILVGVFITASYRGCDLFSGGYMVISIVFLYRSEAFKLQGNKLFGYLRFYNWIEIVLQLCVQLPLVRPGPADPFCPNGSKDCMSWGTVIGLFQVNHEYFTPFINNLDVCIRQATRESSDFISTYPSCDSKALFPSVAFSGSLVIFVLCALQSRLYESESYRVYVMQDTRTKQAANAVQLKRLKRLQRRESIRRAALWKRMAHAKATNMERLQHIVTTIVRRIDEGFSSKAIVSRAPTNLRVITINPTSVSLCWRPPANLDPSLIASYKVLRFSANDATRGQLFGSEMGEVDYVKAKEVAMVRLAPAERGQASSSSEGSKIGRNMRVVWVGCGDDVRGSSAVPTATPARSASASASSSASSSSSSSESTEGWEGWCEATITELQPDTDYQFKVLAISLVGPGPSSDCSPTVHTKPLPVLRSCRSQGLMKLSVGRKYEYNFCNLDLYEAQWPLVTTQKRYFQLLTSTVAEDAEGKQEEEDQEGGSARYEGGQLRLLASAEEAMAADGLAIGSAASGEKSVDGEEGEVVFWEEGEDEVGEGGRQAKEEQPPPIVVQRQLEQQRQRMVEEAKKVTQHRSDNSKKGSASSHTVPFDELVVLSEVVQLRVPGKVSRSSCPFVIEMVVAKTEDIKGGSSRHIVEYTYSMQLGCAEDYRAFGVQLAMAVPERARLGVFERVARLASVQQVQRFPQQPHLQPTGSRQLADQARGTIIAGSLTNSSGEGATANWDVLGNSVAASAFAVDAVAAAASTGAGVGVAVVGAVVGAPVPSAREKSPASRAITDGWMALRGQMGAPDGISVGEGSALHDAVDAWFTVRINSASSLAQADTFGLSDPYVTMHVLTAGQCDWKEGIVRPSRSKQPVLDGGTLVGQTSVVYHSLDPIWKEADNNTFSAAMPTNEGGLLLEVWDYDVIGRHDFLGEVRLSGAELRELLSDRNLEAMAAAQQGESLDESTAHEVTLQLPLEAKQCEVASEREESHRQGSGHHRSSTGSSMRRWSKYVGEGACLTISLRKATVADVVVQQSWQRSQGWQLRLLEYLQRWEDEAFALDDDDDDEEEEEEDDDEVDKKGGKSAGHPVHPAHRHHQHRSSEDQPFVLLLGQSLYRIACAWSESACYGVFLLSFIAQGDMLSMVLPIAAFTVFIVEAPHPTRNTWKWAICWTCFVLVLRFFFQLPFFCLRPRLEKDDVGTFTWKPSWQPDCEPAKSLASWKPGVYQPVHVYGLRDSNDGGTDWFKWDLTSLIFILAHRATMKTRGLWKSVEEQKRRAQQLEEEGGGKKAQAKDASEDIRSNGVTSEHQPLTQEQAEKELGDALLDENSSADADSSAREQPFMSQLYRRMPGRVKRHYERLLPPLPPLWEDAALQHDAPPQNSAGANATSTAHDAAVSAGTRSVYFSSIAGAKPGKSYYSRIAAVQITSLLFIIFFFPSIAKGGGGNTDRSISEQLANNEFSGANANNGSFVF
jgi:hypothetical protein